MVNVGSGDGCVTRWCWQWLVLAMALATKLQMVATANGTTSGGCSGVDGSGHYSSGTSNDVCSGRGGSETSCGGCSGSVGDGSERKNERGATAISNSKASFVGS